MSTAEEMWGSVYYQEKYEKPEIERLRKDNAQLTTDLDLLAKHTNKLSEFYRAQIDELEAELHQWREIKQNLAIFSNERAK